MRTFTKAAFATALLLSTSISAYAVERGGTLTYGRYADSLFLEPVLNDANVDIWVLSNLYDTLLLPTDDGKGVQAGLATDWKLADDGLSVTLTLRLMLVVREILTFRLPNGYRRPKPGPKPRPNRPAFK